MHPKPWEQKQSEIGAAIAAAIKTAADTISNRSESERNKQNAPQWAIFAATLAGALFAAAAAAGAWYYADIAAQQRDSMDKTLSEVQKQTTASQWAAYSACKSAQIARDSLADSIQQEFDIYRESVASAYQAETAIVGQRADVRVMINTAMPDIGGPFGIHVYLKNVGKQAATDTEVTFRAQLVPRNGATSFVYARDAPRFGISRLEPDKTYPENAEQKGSPLFVDVFDILGNRETTTVEDITDMISGRNDLILLGKGTYRDSLGRHPMQACIVAHQFFPNHGVVNDSGHRDCYDYNRSYSGTPLDALIARTKPEASAPHTPEEVKCAEPPK